MPSTSATAAPAGAAAGAVTSNAAPSLALRIPRKAQRPSQEKRINHGTLRYPFFDRNAIRYVAADSPCITDSEKQDAVVRSVWSRVRHLLPDRGQELEPRLDVDLAIVFDRIDYGGRSFAIIDILCNTEQACQVVRSNLNAIQLEDEDIPERLTTYALSTCAGQPPQSLLIAHIKLPSVGVSEGTAFYNALQHMAAPIGFIPESARVAVATRWPFNKDLERIVVAPIVLSRSALSLSLPELQKRRVNSFQWKGTAIAVEYQDRHLACYHRYAAQHPDRFSGPSRQPLGAPPQPDATVKEEATDNSTKKRKSDGT